MGGSGTVVIGPGFSSTTTKPKNIQGHANWDKIEHFKFL